MLYFRDFQWLLVHGESRFYAYVRQKTRKAEDVPWHLNLRYVAGGTAWRRVVWYDRPTLWLKMTGFRPVAESWKDLEKLSFWELPKERGRRYRRGYLDFLFH